MTGINRTLRLSCLICGLIILALGTARAQVVTGTPPFGSFGGGPDRVNLGNNNIHWGFGVVNKAGRGVPVNYALTYDSSVWTPVGSSGSQTWSFVSGWGASTGGGETGYVTYTDTQGYCVTGTWPNLTYHYFDTYTSWVYHDVAGVPHSFNTYTANNPSASQCGPADTPTNSYTATDGSGFKLSITNYTVPHLKSPGGDTMNTSVLSPDGNATYVDANGNTVTITYNSGTNTTTIGDTLGTTALTITGAGTPSSPTQYQYTAGSGAAANVKMNYTSYTLETNFGCSGITDFGRTTQMTQALVSSISLPDGNSYSLTYEATPSPVHSGAVTGRIYSITLPTGGTITYKYKGSNNGINCSDGSAPEIWRYTPDTGTAYWDYARTLVSGSEWKTVVTDPQGNVTNLYFQTATPSGSTGGPNFYETERQVYQGSTTQLLDVTSCYNNSPSSCTRGSSNATTITLPITQRVALTTPYSSGSPGSAAQVTQTYDSTYTLPLETDEYDFGGSLIRKTQVFYYGVNGYTTSCGVTSIPNRACIVQVKDSGGTVRAETDNTYDTNGNLLSETHPNTGGSPSSISRSFTYSSTGVVQTATDFNGKQTSYTNNGCSSSFPTTITSPSPFSFTRTLTYDSGCYGAVVATAKDDQNSATTTYKYNDAYFWRLTEVDYQDGGKTTSTYTDTSGAFSVASSVLVSTGVNHQGTQTLDGLGRVIKSQDTSAGSTVDTTYDSLGRVHSVSNPYVSTSDPTYGLTTTAYDALSRVTSITYPDSNISSISYSGACATSTDAASKARKICADGLGRTISVNEDPSGSLNYPTTYSHNTLDNLTGVTQGTQTRTYVYDMLSRLTSATTPESGATTYTYDANGNVLTRIAPKPNQTGSLTVTTTYQYDELSRLKSKLYNDTVTQSANFSYDGTSVSLGGNNYTMTNTKGRLSSTVAGGGVYTVLSYDTMGRANSYWDCIASGFCTYYGISGGRTDYTYDLAGDLATENYTGGLIYTYKRNAAQQVTEVDSSLVDSWHPNPLVTAVTYTPFGAIKSLTAGRGYSTLYNAVETYDYNPRLQPWRIQLGTAQSTPNSYNCLVYNYYGQNATTCASTPPGGSGGNNGNVMGYFYQDNATPSLTHSAAYSYDGVNRLKTAEADNTTPTCQWGVSMSGGYDQWGNLKTRTVTCGTATGLSLSFNGANQISNSGFTYDAPGNLTADGTHTYSWDAEGRLLTVDGGTEAYAYNVLGQRVQKRVSGVYTNSAHDAFGRLIYHDTGTSQSQIFQWLDNKMIGYYTTWERFAHTNALGSVNALTDVNGNLYQEEQFFPWGQQWTGSIEDDHFAGMDKHDTETGLDPTLFRMFSSNQSRWLSPDPLAGDITNPQSLNRYAYVLNNPTRLTDPSGLQPGWTGNCTSNGYTGSGCQWGGGATTGTNGFPCMSGEYGCAGTPSEMEKGEARFESIITTGWDPALGINWNDVSGPKDPGCGPGVQNSVNQALGNDQTSFMATNVDSGNEKGGNWNYAFQSQPVDQSTAQDIASQINSGPGWPPANSVRFGDIPSLHIENATVSPQNQQGLYTVGFTGHVDTINPDTPLIGTVGHALIDVVGGTLIQAAGGSLGCHQ